jgi:hypothetical protein
MGCRTLNDTGTTHIAEYFGVMIAQDRQTEQLQTSNQLFRAFSFERRDLAPFIETEDFQTSRTAATPLLLSRHLCARCCPTPLAV